MRELASPLTPRKSNEFLQIAKGNLLRRQTQILLIARRTNNLYSI